MIIKACRFRRTKDSPWEKGITFELNGNSDKAREAEKVYTDEGVVPEVYIIDDELTTLCIDFKTL